MARGLTGAITNLNTSRDNYVTREEFNAFTDKFISARVVDIIYDENSPDFAPSGEWNGIGTIKYEVVDYQTQKGKAVGFARPLYGNILQYPLKNEIVFLFKLPGNSLNTTSDSEDYYYINSVSIWNHPHHNAMPNIVQESTPDSQKQDYNQIEGGSARRIEDGSTEINLNGESGGTFVEKTNIHPILPFAGDVILEGRFGNSFRLGNTAKTTSEYANNWSEEGADGDPITIVRNGQSDESSDEGWLPTTEDINTDKSSIYLTSTQKIPVTAVENYEAFTEAPEAPGEYIGNQVILNSGRLVLNANLESVIISGQKSIALSSNENIGISTNKDIVLTGAVVRLGDKEADHPVLLGDDFLDQFANLIDGLDSITRYLAQAQIFPGGAAAPWLPMIASATQFRASLKAIKGLLGKDPPGSRKSSPLLSKVTNTA